LSPWFIGYVKDRTGEFRVGLGVIAVLAMLISLPLYLAGRSAARAPLSALDKPA
jgi:cyanate permease